MNIDSINTLDSMSSSDQASIEAAIIHNYTRVCRASSDKFPEAKR